MTRNRSTRAPLALLLGPGASATRDHPSLVAIDDAVGAAVPGAVVERVDLPKRAEAAAELVAGRAAELAEVASVVVLGGRSFGGRVASMAAAAGAPCDGLALVSYPLHPPGRPEQLRTAHLPDLRCRCLFVSGTRDTFGTPDELRRAIALVAGPARLELVEGGDHGLRRRDHDVAALVASWVADLVGPI